MPSIVASPTGITVQTHAKKRVDTVVIMPVYGQAQYLCESLDDVIHQNTTVNFKIVLIDDACSDPATVNACRKACIAYPEKVHYIRSRSNRGLSSVRNTGIEYSLEQWPELFSILFFDGDDRMHSHLIERSIVALREAIKSDTESNRTGWVFEDPDHFGKDGLVLRVHQYSALFSMAGCSNTSSSMINSELFKQGLRYNENMKSGGEDWHFWLHALKNNFRGKFAPQLGFQYRRRPGSMAFHALKAADKIRTSIRLSHPELFHPDYYLSEEKKEAPRYAVFTVDALPESIASDRQITFPDLRSLVRDIVANERLPTHPVPQFVIFSTATCLTDLNREGLLDWFLWRLELQSKTTNVIASRILPNADDDIVLSIDTDIPPNQNTTHASLFCVSTKWLRTVGRLKNTLHQITSQKRYRESRIFARGISAKPVYSEFEQFINQFNSLYARLAQPNDQHNFTTWAPFGNDRFALSDHFFGATPLLPLANGKDEILCLVREEELIEDDQLRVNIIQFVDQCKAKKRDCSLLILGSNIDRDLSAHFKRILLIREKSDNRRMTAEAGTKALLGLLLPFGAVVSFGAMDYASDLNQLRRYRRKVFSVYSGHSNIDQVANTDLINCFKVYTRVLCSDNTAEIRAQALGVADEQIVREASLIIDMTGGLDAPPD